MAAIGKDAKTELQEWLQARKMHLPDYTVVNTLGAAHQQTFDVACEISQLALVERGIGGSRRAAEQAAASAMLQTIHSSIRSLKIYYKERSTKSFEKNDYSSYLNTLEILEPEKIS